MINVACAVYISIDFSRRVPGSSMNYHKRDALLVDIHNASSHDNVEIDRVYKTAFCMFRSCLPEWQTVAIAEQPRFVKLPSNRATHGCLMPFLKAQRLQEDLCIWGLGCKTNALSLTIILFDVSP